MSSMNALTSLGVLLGSSWGAGVNLYLTVAGLGISQRMDWIDLPGKMASVEHPMVIGGAILIYIIEFFADKIPYFDSLWDSVHTVIRPIGGASLGFMALEDLGPMLQVPAALMGGTISLDSHLTKATTRAAINTSPEPVTNTIASLLEDFSVMGVLVLMMNHPIITAVIVVLFVLASFWFLKKMFRFVKRIFSFSKNKNSS